ncbi:Conserved_hypothetical protein [Hexamita inflata]|uniref:Uncharacterized protein n=1 Tax=Hexamita inflata TaxID=28002 RepID=A0ABP1HHN4_9EUKA
MNRTLFLSQKRNQSDLTLLRELPFETYTRVPFNDIFATINLSVDLEEFKFKIFSLCSILVRKNPDDIKLILKYPDITTKLVQDVSESTILCVLQLVNTMSQIESLHELLALNGAIGLLVTNLACDPLLSNQILLHLSDSYFNQFLLTPQIWDLIQFSTTQITDLTLFERGCTLLQKLLQNGGKTILENNTCFELSKKICNELVRKISSKQMPPDQYEHIMKPLVQYLDVCDDLNVCSCITTLIVYLLEREQSEESEDNVKQILQLFVMVSYWPSLCPSLNNSALFDLLCQYCVTQQINNVFMPTPFKTLAANILLNFSEKTFMMDLFSTSPHFQHTLVNLKSTQITIQINFLKIVGNLYQALTFQPEPQHLEIFKDVFQTALKTNNKKVLPVVIGVLKLFANEGKNLFLDEICEICQNWAMIDEVSELIQFINGIE